MNSVGLVLDVDIAGRLKVISISSTAAEVTKANILPGDQILKIAGKRGTPWTITDASNALAGSVGDAKQLVIKRHGKMLRTFAVVVDLL
jgi:C-terminal processing protease CtpA/Prc